MAVFWLVDYEMTPPGFDEFGKCLRDSAIVLADTPEQAEKKVWEEKNYVSFVWPAVVAKDAKGEVE